VLKVIMRRRALFGFLYICHSFVFFMDFEINAGYKITLLFIFFSFFLYFGVFIN